jgi:hypothetical protein
MRSSEPILPDASLVYLAQIAERLASHLVRWRPYPRKRVGFREALKTAEEKPYVVWSAQRDVIPGTTPIEAYVLAIWWRVAGIPQRKAEDREPPSPD